MRDWADLDSAFETVIGEWDPSGASERPVRLLVALCAQISTWYCRRRGLHDHSDQQDVAAAVTADALALLNQDGLPSTNQLAIALRTSANRHSQRLSRHYQRNVALSFQERGVDSFTTQFELAQRVVELWKDSLERLCALHPRYAELWSAALESGSIEALSEHKRAYGAMRKAIVSVCERRADALPIGDPSRELYVFVLDALRGRHQFHRSSSALIDFGVFVSDAATAQRRNRR